MPAAVFCAELWAGESDGACEVPQGESPGEGGWEGAGDRDRRADRRGTQEEIYEGAERAVQLRGAAARNDIRKGDRTEDPGDPGTDRKYIACKKEKRIV